MTFHLELPSDFSIPGSFQPAVIWLFIGIFFWHQWKRIEIGVLRLKGPYADQYEKKIRKYWRNVSLISLLYPLFLGINLKEIWENDYLTHLGVFRFGIIEKAILVFFAGYFGYVKKGTGSLLSLIVGFFLLYSLIPLQSSYTFITFLDITFILISVELYQINSTIHQENPVVIATELVQSLRMQSRLNMCYIFILFSSFSLSFFIALSLYFSLPLHLFWALFLVSLSHFSFKMRKKDLQQHEPFFSKDEENRQRKKWRILLIIAYIFCIFDFNLWKIIDYDPPLFLASFSDFLESSLDLIVPFALQLGPSFFIAYHCIYRKRGTILLGWTMIGIASYIIFILIQIFTLWTEENFACLPLLNIFVQSLFLMSSLRLYKINSFIKNKTLTMNTYRPYIYV